MLPGLPALLEKKIKKLSQTFYIKQIGFVAQLHWQQAEHWQLRMGLSAAAGLRVLFRLINLIRGMEPQCLAFLVGSDGCVTDGLVVMGGAWW